MWRRIFWSVVLLAIFWSQKGEAQYWLGYSSMKNAGVNKLHIQPASSISNDFKYEILIAGIESYSITPDHFPLTFEILKNEPANFLAENHQEIVGETLAFPSFIWKIDQKNAVGLDLKLRSVFAIDPIESSLIQLLTDYIFLGQSQSVQSDELLVTKSAAWMEVGINYSRNLFRNDHHELNLGVTPKIIFGEGTANLMVENVNIKQDIANGTVDLTGVVGLQYSKTVDDWKVDEFTFFGRTTMAFSGGIEYIYRKSTDDLHTLKAGFSILDIGKMKYDRSMYAGDFVAQNLEVPLETFNQVDILKAWADVVRGLFDKVPEEEEHIAIKLPTKLSVQLDYRLKKNFYLNFSSFIALTADHKNIYQSPNFNTFVLTPRYEKKKWGIALPLIYNEYRGYSTGISGSWGPVFLGLTNVVQSITSKHESENLGGYFGFKVHKF